MYQYGNVAVKYQKEKKNRPNIYKQPNKVPQPKQPRNHQPDTQTSTRKGIAAGEKLIYLLGLIFVVATLCILLSGHASTAQLSYEVQFLEDEISTISERNDQLKLEIAELSSPDRILQIAKEVWGLEVNESPVKVLSSPPLKVAAVSENAADNVQSLQEHKRTGRGER